VYVGIDLGTTNSAAGRVSDGETRQRGFENAQGADGHAVGRAHRQSKARVTVRPRERGGSSNRTRRTPPPRFKRLMGTGKAIEFPAANAAKEAGGAVRRKS